MTLAAILGFLIVSIVMTLFSFAVIGSIAALGSSQPVMPRSAVLRIDMSSIALTEQSAESDPMSMLQGDSRTQIGILNAVKAVEAAAADPAVQYIYMKPDMLMATGMAEVEEFRQALERFRESGKAIVSYLENPTNAGYYLASVSDRIYMTSYEGGMSMITGLATQQIFLKDILDRLGVNVQLIRHGKYKSAGEMYIRNSISKENREQNQAMVSSIWETWSSQIAAARDFSPEHFNALIDGLKLNFPQDFLDNGLVDELLTQEELREKLCDLSVVEDFEDVSMISLQDYATLKSVPNLKAKEKIAVIYASGNIIEGNDKTQVAGDRFASIIAGVRKDSTVKAVVFRVNSPGGSVLASEKIKNEMDLLKEVKPVIASYGNYAASGGYWISNNCDYIFSNASTLTGSIGVFSMIPEFSGTLKDIAHVNITTISSNDHADMYSGTRPLSASETAYMQASVEKIYERFTSIVAGGRNLEVPYVDSIAQGRVWTGADALELGLVDVLGGLEDAIDIAAEKAGLENYAIAEYPVAKNAMEELLTQLTGEVKTRILQKELGVYYDSWQRLKELTAEQGILARLPFEISIRQ